MKLRGWKNLLNSRSFEDILRRPSHRISFRTRRSKSRDLNHSKIFDVDAMSTELFKNNYNKSEHENEEETRDPANFPSEKYYKASYKKFEPFKYIKSHEPCLPHSINTVHLQNPYKSSQRLEGFAARDVNFKGTGKSKETTLRSRYNKNFLATRDFRVRDDYGREEEKVVSSCNAKIRNCLKKSQISTTAKQYCMTSTLHGLRYVGDSSLTIGERIFWVISFSLAVITASYYIWFLYRKWVSSPIIISLSPESVSLDEFPFPSITICNMNNARKSEAMRIIEGTDTRKKVLLEDICNFESNSTAYNLNENAISWRNMLHFMINVSQPCTDMLHSCRWHGNHTDCEQIFNPTMTDEGICCNFNSVHKEHLFYNPRDWPDLNITFPFTSIDWNPETGYDTGMPVDAIPWRPYGAGQFYGLTLVLDADVNEYYCSSTASVGFKMLLHNPVETPKIAEFAFAVTPGEETRVIVTPRISTASKTIISVPQRKRKCFFTTERKLRYYRTYTQRNCVLECEANFTQKICHCVQYYMPKSSNTPICEKKDDVCATNARRAMEIQLYDEDNNITPINASETPSCNCWPGCFEINYNVEISQSKMLPNFRISDKYVKKDAKYFTENVAVVHLFFVESQFTKFVKNELFGFTEFLSSTGGLLGLFMGFSFLSFMEIIYFATLRLWCRTHDDRHTPGRTVLQVHPLGQTQNVIYPFAQ